MKEPTLIESAQIKQLATDILDGVGNRFCIEWGSGKIECSDSETKHLLRSMAMEYLERKGWDTMIAQMRIMCPAMAQQL